jgi:hypothetical protein
VTFHSENNLEYRFTGNDRTYLYNFTFNNHSNEDVAFNVKLIFDDRNGSQEVLIKDNDGEAKIFNLSPRQTSYFRGEFTEYYPTTADSGRFQGVFTVVLVNENEQHSPISLVRNKPLRGW